MAPSNLDKAWKALKGGEPALASKAFQRAVEHDPGNADAYYGLGLAALHTGQYESATSALQQAVTLAPVRVPYLADLSYGLRRVGRLVEAERVLQRALDIDPGDSRLWEARGELMVSQGKTDAALHCLHEALRLEDTNVAAYGQLGLLARDGYYQFSSAQLKQMQAMAESTVIPERARSTLLFSLAYHHDSLEEPDRAFELFKRANAMRLAAAGPGGRFDPDDHAQFVEELQQVFTPQFVEQAREGASSSDLPILIVGMMRSGTTLVEQIVGNHSLAEAAGELNHMYLLATVDLPKLVAGKSYPAAMQNLAGKQLRPLANYYLDMLRQRAPNAQRITDKMPTNFQFLGLAWRLFPNARVIHVTRDPLDTCVSCFCNNLQATWTCELDALGRFYRNYQRIMQLWAEVLPLEILDVNYEDLVADPESNAQRVIEFCGLPWEEKCLNFHESTAGVHTASKLQVRKAVHGERLNRWKRYAKHLEPLQRALQGR